MFATIVIVLPSFFEGGAAHLSHASLPAVYDTSARWQEVHALAWYTDVRHEIKPVTAGHRLALAYNLVHTSRAPRPALPANNPVLGAMRAAFVAWNAAGGDAPAKAVCPLEHDYSQANLSVSAMKGADAYVVSALTTLAAELGFRFGFAHLEREERGSGDDDGYRGGRGRYDDESDLDDDDVGMLEVDEVDNKFENLVDADGNDIRKSLDVDEDEMVPAGFVEDLGDHDGQEYEGYMVRTPC
jgi:hypothetical protein